MTIAIIALAIGAGVFALIAVVSLAGRRRPGRGLSGNRGPMFPGHWHDGGGDADAGD